MKKLPVRVIWLITLWAYLAAAGGCTSGVSPIIAAQAGGAQTVPPDQEKYLLVPEDAIEISVWKEPELTKQLVVRPDGKITYPLIGEVQAAGITVKDPMKPAPPVISHVEFIIIF